MRRWDPEKSTRIKWETTYASALQNGGLTQDFTGLSELLLGQAQPKQFQSYTDEQPLGWHWGSTLKDDGSFDPLDTLDAVSMANRNTEIPRSYYDGAPFGTFYDIAAASAESAPYSRSDGYYFQDSVCPAGWTIPRFTNASGTPKSWTLLIESEAETLDNSSVDYKILKKSPISMLSTGGYLSTVTGEFAEVSGARYISSSIVSTSSSTVNRWKKVIMQQGHSLSSSAVPFTTGMSVRCILR